MQTVKYVYWEEDGAWLGYLQELPDYWTQGETLEDLKEHLRDLYADLSGGELPGTRKVDELVISSSTIAASSTGIKMSNEAEAASGRHPDVGRPSRLCSPIVQG